MNRIAPLLVLLVVGGLFLAYGSSSWSPLAGPVAGGVLWLLDRASRPREPRREPAPVD